MPLAGHLSVKSQMDEHQRELAQQRLTRKATRVAHTLADARDRGFSPRAYRRRIGDESPARLADRVRSLRRELKRERRKHRRRATASPTLEAIAACESGGNPGTNTGNGFYGKFQFTLGPGRASAAPATRPPQRGRAEQARRDPLRARGRLALARLRPLGSSALWRCATSSRSSSTPRT